MLLTAEDVGELVVYLMIGLSCLVFCVQKGKLGAGLLGVIILVVGFTAAVRIAKPNSEWAKRYYPPDGEKMRVARLRFPESAMSVSPEGASQGLADQIAKLAELRDDHVIHQEEFEAGKARLLGKSNQGRMGRRIWEGVVWYFAIANGFLLVAAIDAGGEASFSSTPYPWWAFALGTAGFTFWALQLRKRRRSRVTGDDPAS